MLGDDPAAPEVPHILLRQRAASIFAAGLGVRLVGVAYLAKFYPAQLSWGINEAGAIARWLIVNHSFSTPYHDALGPTAWLGPVYPAVVAIAFLVFGVQTSGSALAILVFNAFCSAATGAVVYKIGKECRGEKAGWMWALSPQIIILPWIQWDTCLSALFLSLAMLFTLRLKFARRTDWTMCGGIWGFAALINPALLAPLPLLAMSLAKQWKRLGLAALVAISVIVPWTARNYYVFHRVIPIRSNGLAEVYFANGGIAAHPLGHSMEYQSLGEVAFTAEVNRRAIEYIRSHPAVFFRDCLLRAQVFWTGPPTFEPLSLALDIGALVGIVLLFKKSRLLAFQLLAVPKAYPLIFYACLPIARYRHPIDPVLYALAGVGMASIPSKFGGTAGKSSADDGVVEDAQAGP